MNISATVLKSVRLTAVEEGFQELVAVPDSFRYFNYNKSVNGNVETVGTHSVIQSCHFRIRQGLLPLKTNQHPIAALSKRIQGQHGSRQSQKRLNFAG